MKVIPDSIIVFDISILQQHNTSALILQVPIKTLGAIGETMKLTICVLLFGLLVSVSMGAYQPSSISFSDFNATTLVNVIDDAIIFCKETVDSLVAIYLDFMKSNRIMYFFKSSLPPELPLSTIPLLGSGLVGLLCYHAWRLMK